MIKEQRTRERVRGWSRILQFSISWLWPVFADDYFSYTCIFPSIAEFSVATVKLNCPTPQPQVTHGPLLESQNL